MNFKCFLKDKIFYIISLISLLIFTELLFYIFKVNKYVVIYVTFFVIFFFILILVVEYLRKRAFYNKFKQNLSNLDRKNLILELIKRPNFLDGKILYDSIDDIVRYMSDEINKYKYMGEEYREYIELWVHEIKTPIASSKLIIENNRNKITESIDEELNKINDFIEQVLYYAKSSVVEKDYIIKENILQNIINNVIKKNKNDLINKKVQVMLENLNVSIKTDSKWLEYVINQIVTNSVKYSKDEDIKLKIYSKKFKECIKLYIEDNGIGISKEDIGRVFDKGFTGNNGRKYIKSTGMGLYLCKNLLQKLGHDIYINSKQNVGTRVVIVFPINSLINEII